jgi:twitching motility protein PilT
MAGDLITRNGREVSEAAAAVRLSELDFTDLYISVNGDVLVRGTDNAKGPLTEIPEGVIGDLDTLQLMVFERGQTKKEFFVDYDNVRYRVSRIRSQSADWFTLRKSKSEIPRMKQLGGFMPPVIQYLARLGRHHGLVVLSGATGQGKTTTAYSLLNEYLLAFGDIAVTIEDPPEMMLEGQVGNFGRCFQLRLEQGDDFGTALHDAMRHTPRYIFMGELRKSYDASQALRAAISGHLVITTIHAGSVEETLNSLIKLTSGEESVEFARDLLAGGLAGVIHQTLVRGNGQKPRLNIRFLFPGTDSGIRSLIRDGSVNQLSTQIEQQANRVMQGRPPIDMPQRRG